eukprot:scaffold40.g5152.t1
MEAAAPRGLELLSDDLLERVLSRLTSDELRTVAPVCRRWAELLRTRTGLFAAVSCVLPPRRSRGRDRRNSYTTPCALSVPRIRTWLAARSTAVAELAVEAQYPDALLLLAQLVPPLAPALRQLTVHAACHEWPTIAVEWGWLAGMGRLASLRLCDTLPELPPLGGCLPTSLTELYVDRVGEEQGGVDAPLYDLGWDELPPGLAQLPLLERLTLGSCTAAWADDEVAALAPLAACTALRALALPRASLSACPPALSALAGLTSLSLAGSSFQAAEDFATDAFAPLAALVRLRQAGGLHGLSSPAAGPRPPLSGDATCPRPPSRLILECANCRSLDLSRCMLSAVPPEVATMTSLASLNLSGNRLFTLPPAPVLHVLTSLDLSGTPVLDSLPPALTDCHALQLLDLSHCPIKASAAEWAALLRALAPSLRLLRHSSVAAAQLPAAGGGAGRASDKGAAAGSRPQLPLEYVPPLTPLLRPAVSAPALLDTELLEVLQAAASLAEEPGTPPPGAGPEWP